MPFFCASRILRASHLTRIRELARTKTNWSDTLALPKSQFPARPSPEQLESYRTRCADDLYAWQREHRPKTATIQDESGSKEVNNEFVLHDGPPYANGAVHVGHALNKILKDLMSRTELARGRRVHYRPGWDCHGLPIELKALQQPKSPKDQAKQIKDAPKKEAKAAAEAVNQMTAPEIRQAAAKLASEAIETQRKSFKRWGVMGEWDAPYTTMSKDFELRQLGVFREMVRKGLISRHHRPVHWSPSSRTALAEAELEYDDLHKTIAAFIMMPMVRLPEILRNNKHIKLDRVKALVWTTTPWTFPANKAIAVKDDIDYCVVEIKDEEGSGRRGSGDQFLIAEDRIEHLQSFLPNHKFHVKHRSISGSALADGQATCFNIFSGQESPILQADFVTATSGTGLVHMAPGHGMDDYLVCQQNNVGPAFAPVDDGGMFTADVWPTAKDGDLELLQGLFAPVKGSRAVLDIMRRCSKYLPEGRHLLASDLVLVEHSFTHKNPIDWRTKQPVITRATAQWFADASAIKDRALAALEDVRFIPESGKSRLRSFVEGRSQWCISRQRAWGVPIPALYNVNTGEACVSDDSINHIISVIEQRGSDSWFSDAKDDPAWLHSSLEPGQWTRGRDTMDVWFDSGTSWTSLGDRELGMHLSDVYSEGTDQHRGWFQSSLLTAVATQDPDTKPVAPFKTLATHGFTLDGKGKKMSKSLGNVVSPEEIISGTLVQEPRGKKNGKRQQQIPSSNSQKTSLGPDVLRLWVASSDFTRDVSISQTVLQSVQQALQKYRVTFKFLLGVLHDYSMPKTAISATIEQSLPDRVILDRLYDTDVVVKQAYSEYKFYAGINEVNKFINNELSAFYFEIVKDRLYTGSTETRRNTQIILQRVLHTMTVWLGPVVPHLVEEVQEFLPSGMKPGTHLLRQIWENRKPAKIDDSTSASINRLEHDEMWSAFQSISAAVKIAQEKARAAKVLGNGLACRVEIHMPTSSAAAPNYGRGEERSFVRLLERELPAMLVVSGVKWLYSSEEELSAIDTNSEGAAAWNFEQPMEVVFAGRTRKGKVIVLPPEHEKCVRCWKYVAEEKDVPCAECRKVLVEDHEHLLR